MQQQPTVDKSDDRLVIRIFQKSVSVLICRSLNYSMANQLSICRDVIYIYPSISRYIYLDIYLHVCQDRIFLLSLSLSLPANIEELIVFTTVCNEVILFHNISQFFSRFFRFFFPFFSYLRLLLLLLSSMILLKIK